MNRFLVVFLGSLLLLSACETTAEKQFIQQETTIKEARKTVEEAMEEKGMQVEASSVSYPNVGKTADTSRVMVAYTTLHEPIYTGRAFLNVNKTDTPKLAGVDHLGLSRTEGLLSIGSLLIEHLQISANQSVLVEIQPILDAMPQLDWNEEEPLQFTDSEVDTSKLDELLHLYGKNQLENPTAEEAKIWLKEFEATSINSSSSEMWLTFDYSGQLQNEEFEKIVDLLGQAETLQDHSVVIRVIADSHDETEEPLYNGMSNGQGSNVFIGY